MSYHLNRARIGCLVHELCANIEARHLVNSAPFFLSINAQSWIPAETKARLLEWKIRSDLMQYAARAVPSVSLDDIKNYQPENPEKASVLGKFFVLFVSRCL